LYLFLNVDLFQVVDARAGPGTKSLSKFKSLKSKKKPKLRADLVLKSSASPRGDDDTTTSAPSQTKRRKHTYRKQTPVMQPPRLRETSPGALSDDIAGQFISNYNNRNLI
jgi:hypothetical protein